MNPFLFGSRDRALFGIHAPPGERRRRVGAVICPPLGDEYQRAHRAARLLGERLAARGYDVLRFDYYGTGDSGGDTADVTLSGGAEDTIVAIDELCARAELRRVMLVGIRAGALMAHAAALRSRAVDALALWDPVTDGAEYLSALRATPQRRGSGAGTRDVAISPALAAELAALRAESFAPTAARTLVVTSQHDPRVEEVMRRLREDSGRADHRHIESPPAWKEEAALGVGAVPVELMDVIAEWEG